MSALQTSALQAQLGAALRDDGLVENGMLERARELAASSG